MEVPPGRDEERGRRPQRAQPAGEAGSAQQDSEQASPTSGADTRNSAAASRIIHRNREASSDQTTSGSRCSSRSLSSTDIVQDLVFGGGVERFGMNGSKACPQTPFRPFGKPSSGAWGQGMKKRKDILTAESDIAG